ncbi:hypothetical protein F5Y10DRAFT_54174 [Nemania abortiva]|nr:hypothetical protein F5Y10DRAFT_54174 [Nemania abortiva]
MLRRSHRKTKKGSKCEECRRRHIRCDQLHPSCMNCQSSDRICSYVSTDKPRALPPPGSSSITTPPQPPVPPHRENTPRTLPPPARSLGRLSDDSLVNITHLELLHHFIQGSFLFIDRDTASTDRLKRTALSRAFANLYVMHGILAFAARHISTQVPPEISGHYLDQTTQLQTWAVANFHPGPAELDQDVCVTLFLFSSLICVQNLADITPPGPDPEPFFIRLGHYFGLQRGVRTIISDHWSRLTGSELQPLLEWCDRASLRKGQGSECQVIRDLVTQSTGLSPAATEACYVAIEQLQCVLDEYSPHRPMPVRCIYLTLAWPLLIPDKMVDLLVLRRPVALIILAYYGATLDSLRDLWMVGQTGKHVVHAVERYLSSDWAPWLLWPLEAVSTNQAAH